MKKYLAAGGAILGLGGLYMLTRGGNSREVNAPEQHTDPVVRKEKENVEEGSTTSSSVAVAPAEKLQEEPVQTTQKEEQAQPYAVVEVAPTSNRATPQKNEKQVMSDTVVEIAPKKEETTQKKEEEAKPHAVVEVAPKESPKEATPQKNEEKAKPEVAPKASKQRKNKTNKGEAPAPEKQLAAAAAGLAALATPAAAAAWTPLPFSELCKEEEALRYEHVEELELALEQFHNQPENVEKTYATPAEVAEFAAILDKLMQLHQSEMRKVLAQMDRAQKEGLGSAAKAKDLETSSRALASFGVVLPSAAAGGEGAAADAVSSQQIVADNRERVEMLIPALTLTKMGVQDHASVLLKKTLQSLMDWSAAGWTSKDMKELSAEPGAAALFWLCGKTILLGDVPVVGTAPVPQRKKAAFQLFVLSLSHMTKASTSQLEVMKLTTIAESRFAWGARAPPPPLFGLSHQNSATDAAEASSPLPMYLGEVWFSLGTLISTLEPTDLSQFILTSPPEFGTSSTLDRSKSGTDSIEEHTHVRCLEATMGNHGRAWNSLAMLLAVREADAPTTVSLFDGTFSYEEIDCYAEALRCAGGANGDSGSSTSAYQGDTWANLGLSLSQGDSVPLPRYGDVSLSHYHSAVRPTGGATDEATSQEQPVSRLPLILCDRKLCLSKTLTYSQENHETPEYWIELAKCLAITYEADVVDVATKAVSPEGTLEESGEYNLEGSTGNLEGTQRQSRTGGSRSTKRRSSSVPDINGPTGKAVLYRVKEERVQIGTPGSQNPGATTVGYSRVGCLLLAIALDVKNYEAWYYFSLSMEDEARARTAAKKASFGIETEDVSQEVEVVLDPNVYTRSLAMAGEGDSEPISLTRCEALAWCISINSKNPKAWFALGTTLAERDLAAASSGGRISGNFGSDDPATAGGEKKSDLSTQAVDPELGVDAEGTGVVTYKDCMKKCQSLSPSYAKASATWLAERGLTL